VITQRTAVALPAYCGELMQGQSRQLRFGLIDTGLHANRNVELPRFLPEFDSRSGLARIGFRSA